MSAQVAVYKTGTSAFTCRVVGFGYAKRKLSKLYQGVSLHDQQWSNLWKKIIKNRIY